MEAKGNVGGKEAEIERDGDTVATISKKWFRVRTRTVSRSRRTRTPR